MTRSRKLWVGYSRSGGRAELELGGQPGTILLLGGRADEMVSLLSLSVQEAGLRALVLDLNCGLPRSVSGYFETMDFRSLLYDAFRIDERAGPLHAQMIAAAYAAALDLSSEEEAIMVSALQKLAAQDNMASPPVLFDALGAVEGFRGFYVDKLKGRIGSLKLLEGVEDGALRDATATNALVDFRGAPYPLAAELAASLFLAKLLATCGPREESTAIFLTGAHRVFRSGPRLTHGNRLLIQLLEASFPVVMATGLERALNPLLLESCQSRVYSSDAWHRRSGERSPVLPSFLVSEAPKTGQLTVFLPRLFPAKTGGTGANPSASEPNPELTRALLEEIDRYPLSTRESLVNYLSAEHLPGDINDELDRLHHAECVILESKEAGPGPDIFAYTLTEAGGRLLKELRG